MVRSLGVSTGGEPLPPQPLTAEVTGRLSQGQGAKG